MKNSKTSAFGDRLSELPDSLIFHIFWLMPMEDVVRTSVLSKRWEKLWTTSPYLNFKVSTNFEDAHLTRTFVNRALICWRGISILKFRIAFKDLINKSLYSDIDLWLRFAMDNGVEELYLEFYYEDVVGGGYYDEETNTEVEPYMVPQYLYSYSSLKVLSLKWCNLQINASVLWNRLKVLDMSFYALSQHSIDHIFSGSPLLEACTFTHVDQEGNMSIRSSSLKKLSIEKTYSMNGEASEDTELTIWCPNLEILEIFGNLYSKNLLLDTSSLTHATLWMKDNYRLYQEEFIEEIFRHILPTIQHVESFTLGDWSLKVLGAMKKKGLLSPFPNVKFLRLNAHFIEYEQILGLLEIFPKLKRLVLEDGGHSYCNELFELNTDLPKSSLLQLRTIDVTWVGCNIIFPFVEFLLKYASNLERMVFRVEVKNMPHAAPSNFMLLASKKLLGMKRSSPNAELIYCEY